MLAHIFPQHCLICKHKTRLKQQLCEPCQKKLPIYPEVIYDSRQPSLDYHALFYYQDEICFLLKQLKFKANLSISLLFGNYLAEKISQQPQRPELIIPIPLHKKRLQQRGFNQCVEIAKVISKKLNIPIDKHSVIRTKNTKPQAQCTAAERKLNTKNAFAIKKPIKANHIMLLDDVITTGNTINACHKILIDNSIKKINIWCVAKATCV